MRNNNNNKYLYGIKLMDKLQLILQFQRIFNFGLNQFQSIQWEHNIFNQIYKNNKMN